MKADVLYKLAALKNPLSENLLIFLLYISSPKNWNFKDLNSWDFKGVEVHL